jgi:hypothetical protein
MAMRGNAGTERVPTKAWEVERPRVRTARNLHHVHAGTNRAMRSRHGAAGSARLHHSTLQSRRRRTTGVSRSVRLAPDANCQVRAAVAIRLARAIDNAGTSERYPALHCMQINKTMMVCSPFLLLLTTGATECQYFSSTTVPAVDTSPPAVLDGVWINNEFLELVGNPDSFEHHLGLNQPVVAVASAIDTGGVRKVEMITEVGWSCCSGNICSSTQSLSAPIIATQNGAVGGTVSNGVWTGAGVEFTNPCRSGTSLRGYRFAWQTTAEDFHGNTATGAWQTIRFP